MSGNTYFNHAYAGIEAISIFVPNHYFPIEDLARVRGVDEEKFTIGLGCKKMSVLSPFEDPVTMAATAMKDLIRKSGISKDQIGCLVVGSESGVDESKPIAVYLHEMLGLEDNCRCFDIKNACYAGTAALRSAMSWAMTPASKGRKAVVITTDVAYYDLGSPGEPTQGAGACAMLIGTDPGVLSLDTANEAVHTNEVMDFWRPAYRNSAIVNGHYSLECYLEGLRKTWSLYRDMTSYRMKDYDYLLFHTPFPKMAWKAHNLIYKLEGGFKALGMTEEESFNTKVLPTLKAAQEMGNIYTSSIFAAITSLVEFHDMKPGMLLGVFSYGSGSSSEFISGTTGKAVKSWANRTGLSHYLSRRRKISYDDYVLYRAAYEQRMKDGYFVNHEPSDENPFVYLGIKNHKRLYSYTAQDSEDVKTIGLTKPLQG
ncbi:MAG: hydroxymethylglutaryl-CoA synthase family protein [Deltaproteobacteria bacterium]|nr:hydroxymethylglutaryl-CoA synthase family protein [Deltaproteobacteria bacterium]